MQHLFSALQLLVVPVHHGGFAADVHRVVVKIAVETSLAAAFQLALQLRIGCQQQVVVLQLHVEEVAGVLNVRDAAFPEEAEYIHLPHGNVTEAVQFLFVPENAVDAGARLQLVVPHIVVDFLKIVLLQHHRHDGAEHFRLRLVSGFPGQNVGGGEIVHGIGVLVGDGVEQPAGRRLHLILFLFAHALPVAQLVPLLVFHNAPLQIGLALFVAVERLPRF